ncbi:hypothetical protein LUZ60_005055 [Juncus effusus]|nr:hypothetical protein LUZ60_005055 [Juncus effusus]
MAVADRPSGSGINHQRRVELKRIENEDARYVCFSKRRAGLFRKASELSTLCGADIAIIVNSPTGRPYSFGSPAFDPVINRFLSNTLNQPGQNPNDQAGMVNHLNQELMTLRIQLGNQLAKKPALNERIKEASDKAPECEWIEKIEQLNYHEFNQFNSDLGGSGRLNIGSNRFNPSSSGCGSNLDPTGLNPESSDPNPDL